jgi:energy-coupling factor transport system permease protein
VNGMGLYEERNTWVHRSDPVTKLFYGITVSAIPYILPYMGVAAFFLCLNILLLVLAKVFRKILPILFLSFFLMLSIVIVHGIFHPDNRTPLFSAGGIHFYREGLSLAALLIIRLLNMICGFGVVILTTKPDLLVNGLVQTGLSPRIGYVIHSVFRIIPQMVATVNKIKDAQRARGVETEGNLLTRAKALFPLLVPVIMSSLIATKERTMALELRGFGSKGKRTFLKEYEEGRYSHQARWFFLLLLLGSAVWRVLA